MEIIQPKSIVYLEDCIQGMKRYENNHFDLAIVDPPYGNIDAIGLIDNKKKGKQATKRTNYKLFENIAPDDEYYCELARVSKNQIVWGGNFLGLCGGVIVWQKNGTAFGEAEVAICSTHKSVKVFEYTWNGMIQQNMKDKEIRIHPTQKPVALYDWILHNYAKQNDLILDTHLGSGSSRIAAYKGGFNFVGFEIDQEYYEKQEKRFNDFKSQLRLF
jgi:site-specific DNA-methyltransferase (adenine-specific)